MNYSTGISGFLGSHLAKQVETTSIPHISISSTILQPFDKFYFLSSYGNMSFHSEDDMIMQANVIDLIKIIDQAVKFNFQSFVFISTSSVKLHTQTMYSRAKRASEEILLSYMEKYNKPICIIRPFSITGVGEQDKHLIPTLIRSCMTGELVNFVPYPAHDYIDIDDMTAGILSLSEHRARGIFELGTGTAYTNQQVLEIVESVTGKKANINLVPSLRSYDTDTWISTNFKARGFGWFPKKSLKDSITEMVKKYELTGKKGH